MHILFKSGIKKKEVNNVRINKKMNLQNRDNKSLVNESSINKSIVMVIKEYQITSKEKVEIKINV
jgi:hypothetical protein